MIPSQDELRRLHAEICSGVADPIRIAILYVLSEGPVNVGDITTQLDLPQSTVSRHLRILRDAHLVLSERQGQNIIYKLTDPRVITALDLLREVYHARITAQVRVLNSSL
jgi:DNA-binding transcriptional ArsR family regulator